MRLNALHTAFLGTAVLLAPNALTAQTTAQLTPKDKTFISEAAEGGLKEIQFSQLALQKSSNDDVKTFAQKMITDHTQLNNDMQPFAQQAGITPPTQLKPKDQTEYDQLSKLSGSAFDHKYIQSMVKDHHKDLKEFKTEAAVATDPSFKTTVESGEKVIQQHTDMADNLAKTKGAPQSNNSAAGTTGL